VRYLIMTRRPLITLALAIPALLLGAACMSPLSAAEFKLLPQENQHLDVLQDGRIIARYMHAYDDSSKETLSQTYKPYLHVFDAEGKGPITKGPGGDFPHHRAIFLGWNKIKIGEKTYDRWHMKGGDQVHQAFSEQRSGADGASFTSVIHWNGEGDQAILEEQRSIAFLPTKEPFYAVIDVSSTLQAVAGDTELGGDPEHAGLQFRPAQEVDRSKTKYLFPGDKADPTKDLDYPWFAESYVLNGKTYSVVYLNHDSNPKGARTSAYRDYGRFGSFYKTSVKRGENATIKVRFLIKEGDLPEAALIQQEWNAYTGKNEATPKTTLKDAGAKKKK